MEKIAIIKLGAHTIKLSLIDIAPNGFYNLFDEVVEVVKIGASIETDSLVKSTIISESLNVLKLYRKICDANNVTKIVAVSENFIKLAKNQKSFFDEIYNNTGFAFSILTTEEEIRIAYKGIASTIDISKAIGVYITPNQTHIMNFNRRTVLNVQTIEYGYLNLAEKFDEVLDPAEKCEKMKKEIAFALRNNDFINNIEPEVTFVGVGSVFESLGKLSRKISKYSLDIENNYVVTKESFDSVYDVVKTLDLDKTKKLKGISEERADALSSGMSIIGAMMETCKMPNITVCANGFDEGIVTQSLPADVADRIPTDMLTNSLETIRTFYDRELSNTENVYNIALVLFKQLKVIHKLPRNYVKSLRIAASMYNCGTRIGFNNYAAKSFEIILNSKLNGASQKDILVAAFACKCQNLDNLSLAEWMKYRDILTDEDLDAVRKLGVIISLACAMDKSRMGNIKDITCDILGDSIIMKTIVEGDASFDIMQTQKVAPDFKKVLKKTLQVI